MSARCITCQAVLQTETEICASCRTTFVSRLDERALRSDETGPFITLSEQDALQEDATETEVPFCGRQAELSQLLTLVEESLKTRSLRVFLLTGQTGQGKTRLAQELGRLATVLFAVPPDRILRAAVAPDGSAPLTVFGDLLRCRLNLRRTDPDQHGRDKLLRLCRVLLPTVRATEVAHVLGDFFGIPFPDSPLATVSGRSLKHEARLHATIRRFFIADGRSGPLVLFLDDLDHASPETVRFLSYLIEGLTDLPVVLGLSAEAALPDFLPNPLPQNVRGVTQVALQPLSVAEKTHLLGTIVGTDGNDLPDWLVALSGRFAESSPRALVELLRLLVETQVLSWQPGPGAQSLCPVWDDEKRAALKLPESLPGVVRARLCAMADGPKRLLEYAACAGECFHVGALLALGRSETHGVFSDDCADADGPALALVQEGDLERQAETSELIEQLIGQGVLAAMPSSQLGVDKELCFAYPPWQKTVYEQIPVPRRRSYHLLLAQFLSLQPDASREDGQAKIARHYQRAAMGLLAAQAFEQAAAMAVQNGADGRAVPHLVSALSCLPTGSLFERLLLWKKIAAAFVSLGNWESALAAWEKVARLAFLLASRKVRAQAFLEMARIVAHDPGKALSFLQRAHDLFSHLQDQDGISDTLDEQGRALLALGETQNGFDKLAQALEMRRQLGNRQAVARSLLHLGEAEIRRGDLQAADSCFDEALRKHEGQFSVQAAALLGKGQVELTKGETLAARVRFEDALAFYERLGPSPKHVQLLVCLGEALRRDGLLGEAESRLRQAEEMAMRLLDAAGLSESYRQLALVKLKRGEKQQALACCERALEKSQSNGLRTLIARTLLTLGEIHAETLFDETVEGEHPAWDYLKRAVSLLRQGGDQIELSHGLSAFCKLLIERRKLGPGRAALREAYQLAERMQLKLAQQLLPLVQDVGG